MFVTIGNIVSSALFALGKETGGKDATWLMSRGITYFSSFAPIEGNIRTEVTRMTLGNGPRIFSFPEGASRISRIAYECGVRHYSLRVDHSLSIPANFFSCDTPVVVAGCSDYPTWGNECEYWPHDRAYRIVDRNIIFSSNLPSGTVYMEYLTNGNKVTKDSIVDNGYFAPIERWLMAEYVLLKGNDREKSLYQELINQHEALQYNANTFLKMERLNELAQAGHQLNGEY